MIHIILQDVIQDCPVYEVFQKEFIGEKLAGEVQLQMDKAEKEKQQDPKLCADQIDFRKSFVFMFNKVTSVIECREEIEFIKEKKSQYDKSIYEYLLGNMKKRIEICEKLLLIGIQLTVRDSCKDV